MSLFFILILLYVSNVLGAPYSNWAGRTIYQLLTDRFAKPLNASSNAKCKNLSNYCGGTFDGIEAHLDYIHALGFDAIWISPIPENTRGGYHGYWMKNLYEINTHFGTMQSLKSMVSAAHKRGMFVMLDVVANHVGPVLHGNDFSSIVPFNDSKYYHDCSSCSAGCSITDFTCFTKQITHCRLVDLPDLNQSRSDVCDYLFDFIRQSSQLFDGLRIDTVPEVQPSFWRQFVGAANDTFAIGEVFSDDVACVAKYASPSAVGGILSYPLYFAIRDVFARGNSMREIATAWQEYANAGLDIDRSGTFIGNHDNPRFLNESNNNVVAMKAALTFAFTAPGVPIHYYGDEQLFHGGNDPQCRESFWQTNYALNKGIAPWLQTLLAGRRQSGLSSHTLSVRHVDDEFLAFQRGNAALVCLTNQQSITRLHKHFKTTFTAGTQLKNVFWPNTDVITVGANGMVDIYLLDGESKLYI